MLEKLQRYSAPKVALCTATNRTLSNAGDAFVMAFWAATLRTADCTLNLIRNLMRHQYAIETLNRFFQPEDDVLERIFAGPAPAGAKQLDPDRLLYTIQRAPR